jgi:ubiquinone/menaquinone biosynthesis C-methylase UbiE
MFNNSKDIIVKTFDNSAQDFDTIGTSFFRHYGKCLVDLAPICDDDCVLDIACGKGATTFPIAEKLSGRGKVYGIDISSKMIDQCKMQSEQTGIKNVEFSVMDAEHLKFENESIDKVVCGFGLFFLPDIEMGFKEIRRVLKKGGTLLFSSWNREYQHKWFYELIMKYISVKTATNEENWSKIVESDFGTLVGLEKVLTIGGFKKELIQTENLDCFYKNEDEWLETYWHTAFRMFFEQMSKEVFDRFKDEAFIRLQNYKSNGQFKITRSAFLIRAGKTD